MKTPIFFLVLWHDAVQFLIRQANLVQDLVGRINSVSIVPIEHSLVSNLLGNAHKNR